MYDATKAMIPNVDIEKEYEVLNELMRECHKFLEKWRADVPYLSSASADAVVSVFDLHAKLVARRAYILGMLHQERLPF